MIKLSSLQAPGPELTHLVFEQLSRFYALSEGLKHAMRNCCFEVRLERGDYLFRKGDYSHAVYFIVQGVVTGGISVKGQNMTTFISVDKEFLTAIDGMYGEAPCTEDVKAEEDCLLIGIHNSSLQSFFNEFPEMNIVMRKILEQYYIIAHRRSIFFRMGTAVERYQCFQDTYPDHAHRLSLHVVASFLNIKLSTLQKIVTKPQRGISNEPFHSREEIESFMASQQPFRLKKLTLSILAHKMGMVPHHLSHVLNLYFKQNFSCFINNYRVDYILERLKDRKQLEQYSLDGIGIEAGFSSRSSFFGEFKKRTGLTPAEYIKNLNFKPGI
jgi:AraC-like DNA-binding protein